MSNADRPEEQNPRMAILYAEIDRLHEQARKLRGEILDLRRDVQRERQQRVVAERRIESLKFELETTT